MLCNRHGAATGGLIFNVVLPVQPRDNTDRHCNYLLDGVRTTARWRWSPPAGVEPRAASCSQRTSLTATSARPSNSSWLIPPANRTRAIRRLGVFFAHRSSTCPDSFRRKRLPTPSTLDSRRGNSLPEFLGMSVIAPGRFVTKRHTAQRKLVPIRRDETRPTDF